MEVPGQHSGMGVPLWSGQADIDAQGGPGGASKGLALLLGASGHECLALPHFSETAVAGGE